MHKTTFVNGRAFRKACRRAETGAIFKPSAPRCYKRIARPERLNDLMAVALISALFVAGCGSSSVRRENIYSSKNRNMLQLGGMVLPNDSGNRVSMEVVIFKEPTADDKIEPAPVMLIFSGGKSNFKLAECSTAELLADGQSLPIQDCKYQKSETAREANLSNYRTTNRSSEECLVLWLGLNEFRSFVGAMKAESIICDQSFTLQSWQSEEIKQLLASAEL